jgi:hypothetical protein
MQIEHILGETADSVSSRQSAVESLLNFVRADFMIQL